MTTSSTSSKRLRQRIGFATATLVVALCSSTTALAQPLIERVPQNAILYAGWSGSNAIQKDHADSHWQGLMDSTQMSHRITDAMAQITAARKDPSVQKAAQVFSILNDTLMTYPSAVYITPPHDAEKEGHVFILCQADDKAAGLKDQITAALELDRHTDDPTAPKAIVEGKFLIVYLGAATEAEARSLPKMSLATNPKFIQATKAVLPSPTAIAYVDGERMIEFANHLDTQTPKSPNDKSPSWPKVRDALGLNGFKRWIWTGGFVGKDWSTRSFLEAPAPRTGLMVLFDMPPVSNQSLRLIPKNATWFSLSRLDPGAILIQIRAFVGQMDETSGPEFEKALATAKSVSGVDPEQFLADLGTEWILFGDAGASNASLGMIAINPLRNATRFEASLIQLEQAANQQLDALAKQNAGRRNSNPFLNSRFQTIEQNGIKVHTINLMNASPSWVVYHNNLYVALSPQIVVDATVFSRPQDGSILDNPKFVEFRKRLGPDEVGAVSYSDLVQIVPASYQAMTIMSGAIGGVLQTQGIPNPLPLLLPPLGTITPHLGPCGSVSWADATGIHTKGIAPFPGADVLSPQGQLSVSQLSLGVGILLPALGAARTTANQMKASSELRGIHQSMIVFAAGNNDTYPTNMGILLDQNFIAKDLAMAPATSAAYPADFDQWTTAKKGEWLAKNSSFVFLCWGKKPLADGNKIVGYLKPSDTVGNGINIVYDDNHAEYLRLDEALKKIRDQYPGIEIQGLPPQPAAKTKPAPAN